MFNISQVGSDDVDSDKESRDNKSRYILRKLRNGQIRYRDDGRMATSDAHSVLGGLGETLTA